jgi:heterodisulfide reductase subunit C
MEWFKLFKYKARKNSVLAAGYVVPDSARCVQCGICTFNCPIGIDVRFHVWHRISMNNNQCLTCGECVARCPRGVLRFAEIDIFSKKAL